MAIPQVYIPVKPQDFTLNPVTVNKRFFLNSGSTATTESGYYLWDAIYSGIKIPIGDQRVFNDLTNSIDNSYQSVIWKSIDHQYYRFPYDSTSTLEHSNPRFTLKFLNISASILSFPYFDFGEGIKVGSLEVTNSFFNLRLTDDQNGNIYDVNLSTGSYPNNYNLVAYWGFNSEFRKGKRFPFTVEKSNVEYLSHTFTPNRKSISRNIEYNIGVPINNTGSGICAKFNSSSILTSNEQEFNFANNEDFTISFWFQSTSSNGYQTIISKNTILETQVYGSNEKYNQNDLIVTTDFVSSSLSYKPINVFPYRFEINSSANLMEFRRSDGINTLLLTSSINLNNSWQHISVVKSGSQGYLYLNGTLMQSGSDPTLNPLNKHSLVFGSDDFGTLRSFTGSLDEIRIYDKGLTQTQIQSLADNTTQGLYQTSVVGNVFYRRGKIVISGFDPKYLKTFKQNWNLKYRGTHTIYQYECLVRVPASYCNLSQNPTTLINPNSDLLINDMTGSLEEGALFPYATEIGLYNDKNELLVVGKLSQPVQMRDDVNLNFLIRWDA